MPDPGAPPAAVYGELAWTAWPTAPAPCTPPRLPCHSCYVSGCRQGLHADAPHGPFAFVLSLTPWEGRRFSGGETLLLQPHVLDYWRRFDSGVGTEMPQLVSSAAPRRPARRAAAQLHSTAVDPSPSPPPNCRRPS